MHLYIKKKAGEIGHAPSQVFEHKDCAFIVVLLLKN